MVVVLRIYKNVPSVREVLALNANAVSEPSVQDITVPTEAIDYDSLNMAAVNTEIHVTPELLTLPKVHRYDKSGT